MWKLIFPSEAKTVREIKTNIKKPELVTKRRNQIMKAATELFRKKGYHATTIMMVPGYYTSMIQGVILLLAILLSSTGTRLLRK